MSVNKAGEPIPWYTYPAIEFLEQFNIKEKTVFEWGCGNSSLYFSKRVKNITSIEHDADWYQKVAAKLQPNQQLVHEPLEKYPGGIRNFTEKYDIIIVDGQRRFDCVKECQDFLKDDGMIILDNSDWFYVSAAYLKEKLGLIQVDFHGFGPINDYTWTTSIFFTRKFTFPVKNNRQPGNAMGGIIHDEAEIIRKEDLQYHTSNSDLLKDLT